MKKLLISLLTLSLLAGCSSKKDVSKIKLNHNYIYVAANESYKKLKVTTSPDEDGEVTYESKDSDIATVDEEGTIKGVAEGKTTVTVTSKDNEDVTAELKVYVYPLKVLDKNPYDEPWKWTAAYRVNDYVADQTGKKANDIRDTIIQKSFNYLGAGYSQAKRFGPTYDCSSLIYTLYNNNYKVNVGTYTGAMITVLNDYKVDFEDRKVGDIIFGTDGTYNHVGIYLGNNRMLHSAESLNGVSVSSIYYGPFASVD